jgi:hypothetical protein
MEWETMGWSGRQGDGVGDKGSGDITTVDAETFLEAFGHIPEICLFH